MSAEQNAATVRATFDAYNARDFDRAASLVTEDYEGINVPFGDTFRGPEGARESQRVWAAAFPDSTVEIRSVTVGEDRVVTEFVGRGTHTGPLVGPAGEIPPTGKRVEVPFCVVSEIREGKIARERNYFDSATLLRQLGVSPQEAEAEPARVPA